MAAVREEVQVGEVVAMSTGRAPKEVKARAASESPKTSRSTGARKALRPIKLHASETRTIGRFIATIGGAFLPVASFVTAHFDTASRPMMWALVAAALIFSAPTLVQWAASWTGSLTKALGFAGLVESTMIFSAEQWLSYSALVLLVMINAHAAWTMAGRAAASKQKRIGTLKA